MARFSRRTSSSRPRRTNWIAAAAGFAAAVTPGSTSSVTLADPTDTGTELSNYVDATIVRIRGIILVDWDTTPGTTTENAEVYASIYCEEAVNPGFSTALLSRDSLLWFDMMGMSFDSTDISGTESNDLRPQAVFAHQRMVVDCKAQRKLGDLRKLFLNISNLGISNAVDLNYTYAIRMLVKE